MLKLIIQDDEGHKTEVPFVLDEITIGRQEGNTIRLDERNVSRRHARIFRQNGSVLLEDLGSYNGIRINGEKIQGQVAVRQGDLIQIGDFDLALQQEAASPQPPPLTVNGSYNAATTAATSLIYQDQNLDPSSAPRLVVMNTDLAGREFSCIHRELRIGSDDENDITLKHRSVSPAHATLSLNPEGRWQLQDLESGGGVRVNGEHYGRVTILPGDNVELGQVKLKFLAAGDAAPSVSRSRARLLLFVSATGALVASAVAAVLLAEPLSALLTRATGEAEAITLSEVSPVRPVPVPPTPQEVSTNDRLRAARGAAENGEFDRAADILETLLASTNPAPTEAEALLKQVQAEVDAKKSLRLAKVSLEAGKVELAEQHLEEAAITVAFAQDYEELKRRIDEAKKDGGGDGPKRPMQARQADARVASRSSMPVPVRHPDVDSEEEEDSAEKLSDEAHELLKRRKLKDAEAVLRRCLDTSPAFARCHKLMGTTYGFMKRYDLGAEYYRSFLRLAPEDKQAEQVRQLLAEYEQSRRR